MIAGRVFITINGQRLRSKEGAKLNTGGIERKPAISDSGVDGYMEEYVAPQVDCAIHLTNDIRMQQLQAFKDGTLTYETDSGRVYTLKDAFCAKAMELSKGEVTLVFNASECIEN